jgi:HAE1 family hydrophobic/amphiphilic exporter-1
MIWFEKMVRIFGEKVAGILEWSLGHKRWVGVIVLGMTVLIFALFPLGFIGFEFMPDVDQSEFSVLIELPKDISIEDASAEVARAEQWLLDKPEIREVVSMVADHQSERKHTGHPVPFRTQR